MTRCHFSSSSSSSSTGRMTIGWGWLPKGRRNKRGKLEEHLCWLCTYWSEFVNEQIMKVERVDVTEDGAEGGLSAGRCKSSCFLSRSDRKAGTLIIRQCVQLHQNKQFVVLSCCNTSSAICFDQVLRRDKGCMFVETCLRITKSKAHGFAFER